MLGGANTFCPYIQFAMFIRQLLLAALVSHPNFMNLLCWHVYSSSHTERRLGGVLIQRIYDCERPSPDEMRCHTTVRVWRVVSISSPNMSNPSLLCSNSRFL